jgi:hypothetical protein
MTLTALKGAAGASGLEQATKVPMQAAKAHKRMTRQEARGNVKGMDFPENNNDQLVSNLTKAPGTVKRQ